MAIVLTSCIREGNMKEEDLVILEQIDILTLTLVCDRNNCFHIVSNLLCAVSLKNKSVMNCADIAECVLSMNIKCESKQEVVHGLVYVAKDKEKTCDVFSKYLQNNTKETKKNYVTMCETILGRF